MRLMLKAATTLTDRSPLVQSTIMINLGYIVGELLRGILLIGEYVALYTCRLSTASFPLVHSPYRRIFMNNQTSQMKAEVIDVENLY